MMTEIMYWALLEHYVKQQLFQSLPLHTGPSLNCPGETAELWQNAVDMVELASGKDLNTFKGPNTQVPAELSLSKQIVSQLLQEEALEDCVGRLSHPPGSLPYMVCGDPESLC